MHAFEYLEPATIEDALYLLSEHGEHARLIAGGTDLVPMMKEKTITPRYVISMGELSELKYIRFDEDSALCIGALTTIGEIERFLQPRPEYKPLYEAASQLASTPIRNMATVGGNLCNAAPSAETAPALIALSAAATLVSAAAERLVPLEDFFIGPGSAVLKANEIMTEIRIPRQPPGSGGIYLKYSTRGGEDFAFVGVAVVLSLDSKNGRCRDVRIVLGAAAPIPMRAHTAEAILKGERLDPHVVEAAVQSASDESLPIDDLRGSAEYRREMVKVIARDAVQQAFERAKSAVNAGSV
jgi:carbon-monoxide dehydrogenase medium subunit